LRDSNEPIWGQTEKIGKGTKANYDPSMKTLTFCFNRGPAMTSELLRKQREQLMKDLRDLGYTSRMKYNGEVLVENIEEANLILTKKNGKLMIKLNNKQAAENKEEKSPSDQNL
jgi:hypothetical protein